MKIPQTITAWSVSHNIVLQWTMILTDVLNNHLVQYVEDDELEANDIRQAIVDYLY